MASHSGKPGHSGKDRNAEANQRPHELRSDQVQREQPLPGHEAPPDPADTNAVRASRPGHLQTVPGAGVVRQGADAGPLHVAGAQPVGYPGQAHRNQRPQSLPGPQRPGTTENDPAAVGSGSDPVTRPLNSAASPEATVAGNQAPRRTYSQQAGPSGGNTGVPGIADPNYTAATAHSGADREDKAGNAGFVPRMPHSPAQAAAHDVAALMSANVECCTPETELRNVAAMMADRDCGAIPVVRDMKSMRPVGIVTDRDIVVRALAKGQDLAALRAGDCMTANPLVVRPDTSTNECAWQMARHRIRRAIVIDEQYRCIGIIAQADLARSAPSHITSELVRDISQPSTGTIAP